MRTFKVIAESLSTRRVHPTAVLNTLIETENAGGLGAVRELEARLARLLRSFDERGESGAPLAAAWLEATRLYLEHVEAPRPFPLLKLRDIILEGPLESWPRRRVA